MFDYDKAIRKVPDFPKKGILFYDITSLFSDVKAMKSIRDDMVAKYKDKGLTKIIAIESRGFLLAPLLAEALDLPVILARKKGKLPNETWSAEYQLEYGTDTIEIQKLDLSDDDNILIIDDLIATGGTIEAVLSIIQDHSQASAPFVFSVIGLPFLAYDKKLKSVEITTLVNYSSE